MSNFQFIDLGVFVSTFPSNLEIVLEILSLLGPDRLISVDPQWQDLSSGRILQQSSLVFFSVIFFLSFSSKRERERGVSILCRVRDASEKLQRVYIRKLIFHFASPTSFAYMYTNEQTIDRREGFFLLFFFVLRKKKSLALKMQIFLQLQFICINYCYFQ